MIKKQHFVISSGQYRQDVLVCINLRSKEIQQVIDKYENVGKLSVDVKQDIDKKAKNTALFVYNADKNIKIICLFPINFTDAIRLFDHEKLHCLHYIMNHIGMRLNNETEEAYAYLSEYLMEQFLEKFRLK